MKTIPAFIDHPPVQHHEMRQCCTCRWWQNEDAHTGRCKRYAPHYSKRPADWPETCRTDWCGDWS